MWSHVDNAEANMTLLVKDRDIAVQKDNGGFSRVQGEARLRI